MTLFSIQLHRLQKDMSSSHLGRSHSSHDSPSRMPGRTKVRFDSTRPEEDLSFEHSYHSMDVEDLENLRRRGNEYTLEPEALNEGVDYRSRGDVGPSAATSSMGGSRKYTPYSTHSTMQFTPMPLSVTTNPSSFPYTTNPSSPYTTSAYSLVSSSSLSRSDMGGGLRSVSFSHSDLGHGVRTTSSTHSNRGAVFCKPVQTGKWNRSRPTLEGAEVYQVCVYIDAKNAKGGVYDFCTCWKLACHRLSSLLEFFSCIKVTFIGRFKVLSKGHFGAIHFRGCPTAIGKRV